MKSGNGVTMKGWPAYVSELSECLLTVSVQRAGREIGVDLAFDEWRDLALDIRGRRATIFLIGNGASASMASHITADLAKNGRLRTEVFTDLSLITAISNDMGYEHVFSEPLSRRARRGDMLVAISSSGGSPNILAAVKVASAMGLEVVTLSAMKESNPLRAAGTLNFYVQTGTYGGAETCHAAILHFWMDLIVAAGMEGTK
jgi:D-sedoheptulose 7-phosphate isomerase